MPIPGTKRRAYLTENVGAVDIVLTANQKSALNAIFPPGAASGARYPEAAMKFLNG